LYLAWINFLDGGVVANKLQIIVWLHIRPGRGGLKVGHVEFHPVRREPPSGWSPKAQSG